MCSKFCEGVYFFAWLYVVTAANLTVHGNAANTELTFTESAPLLGGSQEVEDYSMRNLWETYSTVGAADVPIRILRSSASPYSDGTRSFSSSIKNRQRRETPGKDHASLQRPPEAASRSVIVSETYVVGHVPETQLKPPDKSFWVQKLMILSLLVGWIFVGHRAAADGLGRHFLTIWTATLLLSVLRKTAEHSSQSVSGPRQSVKNTSILSILRKVFANLLAAFLLLTFAVLFGPLILFITGVLLSFMLAAVIGIALSLSLQAPFI